MKGAVIYKTIYGGTRQYAEWIAESSGFDLVECKKDLDLSVYDCLIIGSGVRAGKMIISGWIYENFENLKDKSIIIFSVGAHPPSNTKEIEKIVANSIPKDLEHIYFPLQGRMNRKLLGFFGRLFFTIGAKFVPEFKFLLDGFDYIKKENIQPILDAVKDVS